MISITNICLSDNPKAIVKESRSGIPTSQDGIFRINISNEIVPRPYVMLFIKKVISHKYEYDHEITYWGDFQENEIIKWNGPNPELIYDVIKKQSSLSFNGIYAAQLLFGEFEHDTLFKLSHLETLRELRNKGLEMPSKGHFVTIKQRDYIR